MTKFFVLVGLILNGCLAAILPLAAYAEGAEGTPIPTPTLTPVPVALSKKAVQLDVPVEKQEAPNECGLAAAKMVGEFYKQPLSKTQLDWLKTVSNIGEGIMGSELTVAMRASDYDTAVFPGRLNKDMNGIFRHLDKGRPLIAMITSKDGKNSHYDVLTGYDPDKHLLLMVDPASGPMTLKMSEFENAWKRANYFTFLAVPKSFNTEATPIK